MASFDRWCVRGKAIKNRICITDTYISLGLYAFYFWIYTSNISLAHIYTSHIILRHPQVTYTHLGNMAVGRGSIATRSLSKSAFICTSNAVVNFLRPLVYWQKLTILHMTYNLYFLSCVYCMRMCKYVYGSYIPLNRGSCGEWYQTLSPRRSN